MKKPSPAEKDILNPQETIIYFNLSTRRFTKLINSKEKPNFLLMYKSRKLIVKDKFENYLLRHPELKRRKSYE